MSFISEDMLSHHDRIFGGGHLSLYENSDEVNSAFTLTAAHDPLTHREVFANPTSFAFDEWGPSRNGMNAVLPDNGYPIYLDEMPYADIQVHSRGLQTVREGFGSPRDQAHERAKRSIIYSYEEGRLHQHWLTADGRVGAQEEAYIHLQKRPMDRSRVPTASTSFVILPPGRFAPMPAAVDADYLRSEVRERGFYGHGARLRARSLRRRLTALASAKRT